MFTFDDILDEGSKFQNRMLIIVFHNFYIVQAMKYIFQNYHSQSRLMTVPCMGSIQRLQNIKFTTSQSQVWRYGCIVTSQCPWLLKRCFKRGFGDHRKQAVNEFDWIVISIEIQFRKTANRMAKIITFSVGKTTIFIQIEIKLWRHFPIRSSSWLSILPH